MINMKYYLIIGETLRESMHVFDYMYWLLHDKIIRASKIGRTIYIDVYFLKFTSDELYERYDRHGSRSEIIDCRYVERLLDTYNTLASKRKEQIK